MSDFYIASYSFNNDDYIEHYGVKGMRWGVRRYVNKDGSYKKAAYDKFGGEKARKYKESETSIASKKLSKALRKGDKVKANKQMRQIQALNKMTEKDIINEQLGVYQAGSISGALGGAVGSAIAAPIVISKTRRERVERFVDDYKDMTLSELEKVFKNT